MKKKRRQGKLTRDNSWNPRILTLDQALDISRKASSDDEAARRAAAGRAIFELTNRVECRFTGPSNIKRLTRGERMLWDLAYMHGEVMNGGFHQYLCNSTGESGEDVKVYLDAIGSVETLKSFRRLSKIFPKDKIPRDQERRCTLVEKWQTRNGMGLFEKLDRSFFRQKESLELLIVAYVENHRSDFAEPSDEVVMRLKWKNRITSHFCGSAEPEWLAKADAALDVFEEFMKSPRAEQARCKWEAETKAELKALAIAGKKNEVIRIYSGLFMCSVAKAKKVVEEMLKSKK